MLSPENALYVVERSLELIRERQANGEAAGLRERLEKANSEVARLVALAGEVPDLAELAERLRAVQGERAALEAQVQAASVEVPDAGALRPAVERQLSDLSEALTSPSGRDALHALFRGERLAVRPDPDAGFRIEGTAWLRFDLNEEAARVTQDAGRLRRLVAGEGFEPPTSGL